METVMRIAKFVKVTKKLDVVLEHGADNKFMECALAAGADYIVSGDRHILNEVATRKLELCQ